MSRSRLILVLIATVAASMVLGGVAVAVSAPKTVSACTTKSHGVRVLSTKVKCHKGEKKITWRIHGREGARGPKGDRGVAGPTGRPGVAGPKGAAGPTGKLANVRQVPSETVRQLAVAGSVISATAWCDAGEQVIGGGYALSDTDDGQRDVVQASKPFVDAGGQGWQAIIIAVGPGNAYHGVTAYAMCTAT